MKHVLLVMSYASHFAPVLLLIIGWRHRGILWWYALAAFTSDTIRVLLQKMHHPHDWWAYNLFIALEFLLFSQYYFKALGNSKMLRVLALAFMTVYLINTFRNGFNNLNLRDGAFLCIAFIGYALAGFWQLLQTTPTLYLDKSALFWVSAALLLHAASDCVFYLFFQDYLKARAETQSYWLSFHLAANVIKVSLLIPAIRCEASNK